MREIKFKAWDEEFKRWLDLSIGYFSFSKDGSLLRNGDIRLSSQIKILQYTGLQDKNGKDIYEGDVLNVNDSVVVFDNGRFVPAYDFGNQETWADDYKWNEDVEVIGNIYENSK